MISVVIVIARVKSKKKFNYKQFEIECSGFENRGQKCLKETKLLEKIFKASN